MIIIDVDGFADVMTNGTSGMLNSASEIVRAFFSVPWVWIPAFVLLVAFIVGLIVYNLKNKKVR